MLHTIITKLISAAAAAAMFFTASQPEINNYKPKKNESSALCKVIVSLDEKSLAEGGKISCINNKHKKVLQYIRKFYPEFTADYSYNNLIAGFSGEIPENIINTLEQNSYVKSVEKCRNFVKLSGAEGKTSQGNIISADGKFTGKGKVIAVLDSELDTSHEMFTDKNFSDGKITCENVKKLENGGKLHAKADERAFVSKKLPFVYSYTNEKNPYDVSMKNTAGMHGTHVSGIAAGNRVKTQKGEISGAAPDSQIIFMDVFRYDKVSQEYISDDAMVIAALEDAAVLGADAVNLSFGEDTEFTDDSPYKKACENVLKKGTAVFAAAGNLSQNEYSVKNPDNSTVLSPSAINGVMSVACCGENGISAFSSKGVSQSLELKPDITAYGEDVYSSFCGGGYKTQSGTSMSSPAAAGNYIVLTQQLEEKFPDKSKKEIMTLAQNILMNSADMIIDENKMPVSPRFQGAGRINMSNAEKCTLAVTGNEGMGKVNLYDKISHKFTISLDFENLSGENLSFEKAQMYVLTDSSEKSPYGEDNVISGSKKLDFTADLSSLKNIKAGEKNLRKIEVNLNEQEIEKTSREFSNGFFIEGFIVLSKEKNGLCCDISLPFMGFYGDWGKVPVFAEDRQTQEETGCKNQAVTNCGDDLIALGKNNIDGRDEDKIYISPDGNGKADDFGFDMNNLRETVDTTLEIYSDDRRVYLEKNTKCINRGFTNRQITVKNPTDLKDGAVYTARLSGKINYKGAEYQSISTAFTVDKTPPRKEYSRVYTENGRRFVQIKFTDESRLDGVCILGKGKGKNNQFERLADITTLYSKEELKKSGFDFGRTFVCENGKSMEITFDVTDLETYVFVACDGALNTLQVKDVKEDTAGDSTSSSGAGKILPENENPPTGTKAAVILLCICTAACIILAKKK